MRRCCLIVVEDEALLRLLMEMTLEATEYDFKVFSTVGAAMEALEADADGFDVLVTNINLGDAELNGFDLARRARELNPDVQIVYVSGAAGHQFEQKKVPGSIYLDKPFDVDQLLQILRDWCESKHEG